MNVRVFSACEALPFAIPLWKEAFGDSEEEIKHILSAVDRVYGMLLSDAEDASGDGTFATNVECPECIAMACAFDVYLGGKRGQYLYAVCTAEKHRGRGVMRRLMDFVLSFCHERGDAFAFLIPARDEYFPMYEGLGFVHSVPGLISVTDGARFTVANIGERLPFDGDWARLYEIYLATSANALVKNERLFRLSVEGFEIAYLTENAAKDAYGYVIFQRNGKDFLNILEMRAILPPSSGIIKNSGVIQEEMACLSRFVERKGSFPAERKALFHLNADVALPSLADLFLEL